MPKISYFLAALATAGVFWMLFGFYAETGNVAVPASALAISSATAGVLTAISLGLISNRMPASYWGTDATFSAAIIAAVVTAALGWLFGHSVNLPDMATKTGSAMAVLVWTLVSGTAAALLTNSLVWIVRQVSGDSKE